MTGVLVGVLAGAIALAALLGAGLVYTTKKVIGRGDRIATLLERLAEVEKSRDAFQASSETLDTKLSEKEDELEREIAARKLAQRQRDEALVAVAEHAPADAVSDALRSVVSEMSTLSRAETTPGSNED